MKTKHSEGPELSPWISIWMNYDVLPMKERGRHQYEFFEDG